MVKEIRVYVPDEVWWKLHNIEKEMNVTMQDLLLRAIVKVLEEFEKEGKGESK